MEELDEQFMRRAIELARRGRGHTSPNPMVGAVIVADDDKTIIGEGYHRRCGEAHAEVNAVRSVKDKTHLSSATIYVTLEPCAHYGKTPPCAKLLVESRFRRVVIGAVDPFAKVCGRGIAMLREAGIEVTTDVLADDCRRLNAAFFTAHTLRRPFVTLKWAQSRDGYIDRKRCTDETAAAFSTALGRVAVHRLRAAHDAILVGSSTVIADNPLLNNRLWPGSSPRPVIIDCRKRVDTKYNITKSEKLITISEPQAIDHILSNLYESYGITSLLVEGGAATLQSFIEAGLWDVARVEVSDCILGADGSVRAPSIAAAPAEVCQIGQNRLIYYTNNPLVDVKNL